MYRTKLVLLFGIIVFVIGMSSKANAAIGDVIKSFTAPGPWSSRGLAWDGTYLWNTDSGTDTIYKLNPSDGSIVSSFPTASINPWGIASVGTKIWNYDGFSRGFYSVDPSVGLPWTLEFSKPTSDHYGIVYDGTNLWASDWNTDRIEKMDLAGNVISWFPSPGIGPTGLAWDGTNIWVADTNTDRIYQLNPSTGAVITSFSSPSNNPQDLTFDGTYLWNTDLGTTLIYQIDIGMTPFSSTPAPDGTTTLLVMFAGLGAWFGVRRLRFRFSHR